MTTAQPRAWNSPPGSGKKNRLAQSGKESPVQTRCNYYIDGAIVCDTFPSWPVSGNLKQRRCEEHKGQ